MLRNEESEPTGISIHSLYKIFGPDALAHVQAVRDGLSKTDLLTRMGHVLALRDINLDIPAGSIQVIMGLSGSGKSTLIRHINRLIDPTSGNVIIRDRDVCTMSSRRLRDFRRRLTAMVFQKFALLPHRDVLGNVVFGLEICGVPRTVSTETGMRWIERVGLKGFETRYPNQLSGGMQQRVGLARALAMDAPVLLMDEAYSALDPLIRMDMQSVLLGLQEEFKKTVVFITHDLDEALRLGDQIAILRDGVIVQQGTKMDIVLRPVDEYVERFVRQVNRASIIPVESVMSPVAFSFASGGVSVTVGTTIEQAMSKLARHPGVDTISVVCSEGRPVGTVNVWQLASVWTGRSPVSVGNDLSSVRLAGGLDRVAHSLEIARRPIDAHPG